MLSKTLNPVLSLVEWRGVDTSYTDNFKVPIFWIRQKKTEIPVRIIESENTYNTKNSNYSIIIHWIDSIFTYCLVYLFNNLTLLSSYISDLLQDYRKIKKYSLQAQFEQKYSKDDLFLIALQLPDKIKLQYPVIKQKFPLLSKNHIYKVIDIRKNLIQNYKDVFIAQN